MAAKKKAEKAPEPVAPERAYDERGNVRPADGRWIGGDSPESYEGTNGGGSDD